MLKNSQKPLTTKLTRWMGLIVFSLTFIGCRSKIPPTVQVVTPSPMKQSVPTTAPETSRPELTPSSDIAPDRLFISELLPGVPGNNNLEFIELYNAGPEVMDLNGWSLWYRLDDRQEMKLIRAWESRTDIPGYGHFLLVQTGQEVGTIGDAVYDVPLFERKGGLALLDPYGATADTLVWGDGPTDYVSGSPAPIPTGGASLERLPGGDDGNGSNTGDHSADFIQNPTPDPQNSGAPITPPAKTGLSIVLDAPETVEPGGELHLNLQVRNQTGGSLRDVRVMFPVPGGFEVKTLPAGTRESDGWTEWAS